MNIEVVRPRICLSEQDNKIVIETTLIPISFTNDTKFVMSYEQFKILFPEILVFAKNLKENNKFANSEELEALKMIVCKELHIENPLLLYSKTRKKPICIARQIICMILKQTDYGTLDTIGKIFNQNHSTIIHGTKMIKNIIFTKDPEYYQAVVNILTYYKIPF